MTGTTAGLTLREVFGRAGEAFRPIVESLIAEAVGTQYSFLPLAEFSTLPPDRMGQVYWEEMLYRVHWAATSNLQRHQRWFESCRIQSVESPNFLGFCASLRGLTEGAGDARHSLGSVALTLADHLGDICTALSGRATTMTISAELENVLIHFQYARRLRSSEPAPATHRAEKPGTYIGAIDTSMDPVKPMYEELCQIIHPAQQSLFWAVETDGTRFWLGQGDDGEAIREFCGRHLSAIEWVQMASVNPTIMMLKVLNVFPLKRLHMKAARRLDMGAVPGWGKVEAALARHGVTKNRLVRVV